MKLDKTILLFLTLLPSLTFAEKPPKVDTFVKQYVTEEEYKEAYEQAEKSFDYYNSYAYVNQPEYLESNRKSYCNFINDKYAIYDMTVLNRQYESATRNNLEQRADRQHSTSGVDRDILKVMCYPRMAILDKNGYWKNI